MKYFDSEKAFFFFFIKVELTLIGQKHLGEGRQPDKEVKDSAAVGVVRAVVIRLDRWHGVVFSLSLLILLFQILRRKSMLVIYWHQL